MGPAKLHNDLEDAVSLMGGRVRFFDDLVVIRKGIETGCPSDYVKVVIFFAGTTAIAKHLIPSLKDALVAWIQARSSREVEIHAKGIQIRIKGRNDVDEAISLMEKLAGVQNITSTPLADSEKPKP